MALAGRQVARLGVEFEWSLHSFKYFLTTDCTDCADAAGPGPPLMLTRSGKQPGLRIRLKSIRPAWLLRFVFIRVICVIRG